jgi:hypothetical protein
LNKKVSFQSNHEKSNKFKTAFHILMSMSYQETSIDSEKKKYLAEFYKFLEESSRNKKYNQ